jgi:hypothetical protein
VFAIHDSIYRGREDFVYRITVGELPFVTSIFPLGGQMGALVAPTMKGWTAKVIRASWAPASSPWLTGSWRWLTSLKH